MAAKYGTSPFGFEDLDVYKAARSFRNRIYELVKSLPQEEKYALAAQMRRSAISLTSNIAEGYGRFTWQDTTHFCRQARGSLSELADQLNTCLDQKYVDARYATDLKECAARTLQLLNGYIRYLQRNKTMQQK